MNHNIIMHFVCYAAGKLTITTTVSVRNLELSLKMAHAKSTIGIINYNLRRSQVCLKQSLFCVP